MSPAKAVLGSVLFFLVAPGVVAGFIPWALSGGYSQPTIQSPLGIAASAVMIGGGLSFLVHAFARFALDGLGTPAPIAPTKKLVVSGAYRYVRNPMYLAVLSIISGQALLFASGAIAVYCALIAASVIAFVAFYEEPTLSSSYGAEYELYRANVPGWLPRLTPWRKH
ncbi:MAG: isoprenylcysteine carboxylmethyltransferase family protein [Hyphomicrobiales bacterium]|nr:MAG: isoprenylcysteine carboxylmethyltransferase family protein [Hyphomicrobiales bacterium]